jgi:tetratricopeptide (TPR) repeat protein
LFAKTNEREKAVDVYKELIKLYGSDEKKSREFVVKLAETFTSLKNRKDAIDTWAKLLAYSNTEEQVYDIWKKIVSLKEKEEIDFVNKEIETRLNKLKAQQKKAGPVTVNNNNAKVPLQPVPYVPGIHSNPSFT